MKDPGEKQMKAIDHRVDGTFLRLVSKINCYIVFKRFSSSRSYTWIGQSCINGK